MRVLITGSRDWEGIYAEQRIYTIMSLLLRLCSHLGTKLTIIHGDCPTGADQIADRWARRWEDEGVTVTTYPAKWQLYGKRAGPVRNEIMVNNSQADLALAFLRNGSSGTRHTIALARMAGIPTYVIDWEEDIP